MQEYKVTVYKDRTEWRDLKTFKLHRLDGPAYEYANGSKEWWVKGKLHRLDGPAIEYADGYKAWYVEDKRHRLDGPAREYSNGSKEWWVEGKCHRLDGPAIERASGSKSWWIEYSNGSKKWFVEGKCMTEQEFNEYVEKLNTPHDPCNNKVVEIDGKKYKLTLMEN